MLNNNNQPLDMNSAIRLLGENLRDVMQAELAAVKALGAYLDADANHASDDELVLLHRAWRAAEASVDFFKLVEPAQNVKERDKPE